MISLFLDSCDKKIIVALLHNNKLIYKNIEDNDNNLSSVFLPMIQKALDSVHYTLDDVDRIYIVNGPGSFTGIRVGVTTAKVMAWGLKKEIIPISELEVIASTETATAYNIPYIDARRESVYAGMYDSDLNPIFGDTYITIDELKGKITEYSEPHDYTFVSYSSLMSSTVLPNIDIEKIVEKHSTDSGIPPHDVVPNYLKKTEAEENYDRKNQQ